MCLKRLNVQDFLTFYLQAITVTYFAHKDECLQKWLPVSLLKNCTYAIPQKKTFTYSTDCWRRSAHCCKLPHHIKRQFVKIVTQKRAHRIIFQGTKVTVECHMLGQGDTRWALGSGRAVESAPTGLAIGKIAEEKKHCPWSVNLPKNVALYDTTTRQP